jgi:hypothetical protein
MQALDHIRGRLTSVPSKSQKIVPAGELTHSSICQLQRLLIGTS